MAQFRTTADIVDSVLLKSDEVTNGNSAFEARALEYVNNTHHAIVAGGNEFDVDVDEPWVWAKAERPILIELQPKYDTGTISITNGSEAGSFSAAVTDSLEGWHLQITGHDSIFKIAQHTAGATAFELDGAYDGDTDATASYKAFKLDYELTPSYLVVDSTNNKLDFEETASSELTATVAAGVYAPDDLATAIDTALTAAGASAYTITYDSVTRKFTLASDRAGGGGTFKLLGATGSNQVKSLWATIGFDDEDIADAASHSSTYAQGGICKLFEPFVMHKGNHKSGNVYSLDENRAQRDFPLHRVKQGYPDHFVILNEREDGTLTVRFNAYPEEATRVEVPHIPVPRDLKDNAASIPLIPRKYIEVLEYGAAAKLLFEKDNTKWEGYFNFAGRKLKAMLNQNSTKMSRTGEFFGQTIAREDMVRRRSKRRYGYTSEDI